MKKRVISWILCITLVAVNVSGCSRVKADNTESQEKIFSLYDTPVQYEDPFAPRRTEVNFSQLAGMRYGRMDEFKKSVLRMEEACTEEDSLEELKSLYQFLYGEMVEVLTTSAIAQIEYAVDSRSEELSLQTAQEDALLAEMDILYREAIKKVLASGYGQDFRAFIGEDVAAAFSQTLSDPERIMLLSRREKELVAEYYQTIQQTFSIEIQGEQWDQNRLSENRDSFTAEEYKEFRNALLEKKNAACMPVYLELVALRKELASLYGYDNAVEYYYKEIYFRDYSPEEARNFHNLVKQYILPIQQRMDAADLPYPDAVVTAEEVPAIMEEIIPRISGEMADIFHYMVDHEMIYLTEDFDVSLDTGFTTSLSQLAQPFVYNAVYPDVQGLSDTFHEFGHYCDSYLNGIDTAVPCDISYDLAEVCSMGLELLVYAYYEEMMGSDVCDEKLDRLDVFISTIIECCMYDAAQQRIFSYDGTLTAEVVNSIFRETAAEYKIGGTSDRGLYWVNILHNFETPFYHLSYSMAASAALEIWLTAQTQGQDAAIDLYLSLLSLGSFEYGYTEALDACGMRSFRSESFMEDLSGTILAEVDALSGNAA